MNLRILLPFRVFATITDVSRIVAESWQGSFGLLERRLDCVAALAPGILSYETTSAGEVSMAVDEGILVKTGPDVTVSVRRAIIGSDLSQLRATVDREFLKLGERDHEVHVVMARLEAGLLQRMAALRHG